MSEKLIQVQMSQLLNTSAVCFEVIYQRKTCCVEENRREQQSLAPLLTNILGEILDMIPW